MAEPMCHCPQRRADTEKLVSKVGAECSKGQSTVGSPLRALGTLLCRAWWALGRGWELGQKQHQTSRSWGVDVPRRVARTQGVKSTDNTGLK